MNAGETDSLEYHKKKGGASAYRECSHGCDAACPLRRHFLPGFLAFLIFDEYHRSLSRQDER